MVPELEIAELRRRLAEHRALLRQLFELRWRLVNKASRGPEGHAERALRINEETVTAIWRAVRFVQLRLADLELIAAGQHENAGSQMAGPPSGASRGLTGIRTPRRRPSSPGFRTARSHRHRRNH